LVEVNSLDTPNFWVYMLYCKNASFYTGYTTNLCQRYSAHLRGVAAKYTRSFPPLFLVSCWPIYGSKREAMQIERLIKKMDKRVKQLLIEDPMSLEQLFVESYAKSIGDR